MEITANPQRQDYINFFKYFFFKRKAALRLTILLLVTGYIGTMAWFDNSAVKRPGFVILYAVLFVILNVLSSVIPFLISIFRFDKKLANNETWIEPKKILLTDDGIKIVSEHDNNCWKYGTIKHLGITGLHIYMVMWGNSSYVIPYSAFDKNSDAMNFYGALQHGFSRSKAYGSYKNPKRLYWWTLLGIIPVWGTIAGCVLIYKGIVQYKDRKLVILGGLCFITTLSFIVYVNSDAVNLQNRQALRELTVSSLNDEVKKIEFYKMQSGSYPDSLAQTLKDEKLYSVYDPMTPPKSGKVIYFRYRKIGNRYTVFSVGVDGIANTRDDIYPSIVVDTAKFGLIKPQ